VQRLTVDDRPTWVVIQVYITNAYRAYRLAITTAREDRSSPSGDSTSRRCLTRRRHTPTQSFWTWRADVPAFLKDSRRTDRKGLSIDVGPDSDRHPPIRRDLISAATNLVPNSIVVTARCPQHLRLLLQGRLLFTGSDRLHAARRRCARRDLRLPGRHCTFWTIICSAIDALPRRFRRHARHETSIPGRGDGRFHSQGDLIERRGGLDCAVFRRLSRR